MALNSAPAFITRTIPRRSWGWWMRSSSASWRRRRSWAERQTRLRDKVDEEERALQDVLAERAKLKQHCEHLEALLANISYPPGHFYSPIVNVGEPHAIEAVRKRASAPFPAGIAIDTGKMMAMMTRLAEQHRHFSFPRHQQADYRFYFDNPFFGCHDASTLFSMLLEFRPRRVIEIGCGHSSRLLLDTNERFFDGA